MGFEPMVSRLVSGPRLEMSPLGVGFSVERGQAIAHENEYHSPCQPLGHRFTVRFILLDKKGF